MLNFVVNFQHLGHFIRLDAVSLNFSCIQASIATQKLNVELIELPFMKYPSWKYCFWIRDYTFCLSFMCIWSFLFISSILSQIIIGLGTFLEFLEFLEPVSCEDVLRSHCQFVVTFLKFCKWVTSCISVTLKQINPCGQPTQVFPCQTQ